MSETIGVEGRGSFYDGVGPSATSCRTTCCRCWPWWRWSRRPGRRPATCRTRRPRCSPPCAPSTRGAGARPVRRLPRRAGCGTRLDGRDVRGGPAGDRLVALGRRAVVRAVRQGAGRQRHRGGGRVPRTTEPAVRRGRRPRSPSATWCASASASTTGSRSRCRPRPRPTPRQPERGRRGRLRRRAGRAPRGLRASARRRARRLPRRFAREDIVEQTWRVVQPALDSARFRAPLLPRLVGPGRSRPHPVRRLLVRTQPAGLS
jgi:hypothetical protein